MACRKRKPVVFHSFYVYKCSPYQEEEGEQVTLGGHISTSPAQRPGINFQVALHLPCLYVPTNKQKSGGKPAGDRVLVAAVAAHYHY